MRAGPFVLREMAVWMRRSSTGHSSFASDTFRFAIPDVGQILSTFELSEERTWATCVMNVVLPRG